MKTQTVALLAVVAACVTGSALASGIWSGVLATAGFLAAVAAVRAER